MFRIIPNRKIWFTVSGILVIGSLLFILINGLNFGIDFTGGSLLEIKINADSEVAVDKTEEKIFLALPELAELKVQASGYNKFIIRSTPLIKEEHQSMIRALSDTYEVEELRFESIGPTLGAELKDKAIVALIIASIVIILYIAWSFRKVSKTVQSWKYGIGAIVALVHDVVIVTGVYSLVSIFTGFQIDALFVTALLVVLGYSVNDTIVVYDRVRENVLAHYHESFEQCVNKSVNQTITRSINTSLTTMLVLFALFFLGGSSISGFIMALIIGVLIGTYSSIFLASPLLVVWERTGKGK